MYFNNNEAEQGRAKDEHLLKNRDGVATMFEQLASGAFVTSERVITDNLSIVLAIVFSVSLAALGGLWGVTVTRNAFRACNDQFNVVLRVRQRFIEFDDQRARGEEIGPRSEALAEGGADDGADGADGGGGDGGGDGDGDDGDDDSADDGPTRGVLEMIEIGVDMVLRYMQGSLLAYLQARHMLCACFFFRSFASAQSLAA